jgi:hypothetical protein
MITRRSNAEDRPFRSSKLRPANWAVSLRLGDLAQIQTDLAPLSEFSDDPLRNRTPGRNLHLDKMQVNFL